MENSLLAIFDKIPFVVSPSQTYPEDLFRGSSQAEAMLVGKLLHKMFQKVRQIM